ncbi:hypothetical protein CPAST_c27000 [Clostridium pasteurianum DSM 525 = ATCC 6013]|uniref:Uncharacterized protein n=1 Tax=Clostridium pasteurianum DSM 525 = ATCC 6013 TaxID=1262449 RepID=A0A0H3J6F5_CLOPA|nr:DUF3006 domain-containing protein [Clostridium pasteurianum]AJA48767.1 hypothetical protein CPAST_c27000 [Clostridium pasteurianum DSM 525 = ATCC 6013]AJA52755.1 hypothetical protein CLPA_c27000 [Clostridium pasteurianum DSM 525 = ATCC 6013]AOZ75989.1 pyruvate kinase [Clostridium pasteurianum DSM 525 = ATCC 6013]AOZ79785.1 pyruvate kinase [Clostridium pasteurianum]ELP60065.1 hypothetical protein F502_05497 [Clostridium pasteurianum DSM 525 = ATCC 6013]
MKVIVDRFEGKYAVCEKEGNVMINIEKSQLPKGVKEGDVIIIESKNIYIDLDETKYRRSKIKELIKDIWK